MVSSPFAAVTCSVECYPFEGGPVFIEGGQIRSVTVSKTLRGGNGTFTITLAPGGPNGTESSPDWTEIVTPGSHVLIGMARGSDAAIVLDGVATDTGEMTQFDSTLDSSQASRTQSIVGADFAWFFNTQNWYSLAMYGLVAGSNLGDNLGYLPSSIVPLMSQGLVGNGSPVQVGQAWFDKIMAGSGGMLGHTFVPYQGGDTRLPFSTMITETMEQYPNVYVPLTTQFLGLESWMAKFMEIFPWPWYEFFVTTAPSGVYALVDPASGSAPNVNVSGRTFTMRTVPNAPASGPQLVARVNPVPRFDFVQSGSAFAPGSLDMTRWNALPLTTLQGVSQFASSVGFTSAEAKNFYMVNPTIGQTLFGDNGSNVVPFPFVFGGAADPASVHRYGYRPVDGTTSWFYDWQGSASQKGKVDITQTVRTLTAARASWWHPLPLMAHGEVAVPLNPTVYVGTRYRFAPFKDGVTWDFYVEGVTHRFAFGAQSSTVLTLTRGLPSSVYADSGDDGLLKAIYTGNARRQFVPGQQGIYQLGLPSGTGQGLQVFSSVENAGTLAQQMWTGFTTPQTPST